MGETIGLEQTLYRMNVWFIMTYHSQLFTCVGSTQQSTSERRVEISLLIDDGVNAER